jgi:uncharacterized protein
MKKSVTYFLVLALVMAGAAPSQAGPFEEGETAYQRGDYATAARVFQQAAEQGNAEAQYHLARMYARGEGVPQDSAEVVKRLRLAAEQGDAQVQYNLGNLLGFLFANGLGVARNDAEAVKWYRLAAARGNAQAQTNLGRIYYQGQGVGRDYTEAAKWYRLAAEQRYPEAQFSLGRMYAKGEGMTRDYVQAHLWFSLVASRVPRGEMHDRAANGRDMVALRMTPAQLAEARRLAREWTPVWRPRLPFSLEKR